MTPLEGAVAVACAALAITPPTILAWTSLRALKVKATSIETKTDEIKVLANGQLSKLNQALELQNQKVQSLERLLALAIRLPADVIPFPVPAAEIKKD